MINVGANMSSIKITADHGGRNDQLLDLIVTKDGGGTGTLAFQTEDGGTTDFISIKASRNQSGITITPTPDSDFPVLQDDPPSASLLLRIGTNPVSEDLKGLWLDQAELRKLKDGKTVSIVLGHGEEFQPAFDGIKNCFENAGDQEKKVNVTYETKTSNEPVIDEFVFTLKYIQNKIHNPESSNGLRLFIETKEFESEFVLEPKSETEISLIADTTDHGDAVDWLLHGKKSELYAKLKPEQKSADQQGRRRDGANLRLEVNRPESWADHKRVWRLKNNILGEEQKFWVSLAVGESQELKSGPHHIEGDKARAESILKTIKVDVTEAGSRKPNTTGVNQDTNNSGSENNLTSTFSLKFNSDGSSYECSLNIDLSFNIDYKLRIGLDLGAGTHIMGLFNRSDKNGVSQETKEILDISSSPEKKYANQQETSARLYLATKMTEANFYATKVPFPSNFLKNTWPAISARFSDLMVVSGKCPSRTAQVEEKHPTPSTTRFKGHFFRGEEKIKVGDQEIETIGTFKEICRTRFIEAIWTLWNAEKEMLPGGALQFPLPKNDEEGIAPPQFVVTHPAYVAPETVVKMTDALRELHDGFYATAPSRTGGRYRDAVCLVPEPVALMAYLDDCAQVSTGAGSDKRNVCDFDQIGVMDCGNRTVDVASRSRKDGKNEWLSAGGADLGGNLLDIAIGEAIHKLLVEELNTLAANPLDAVLKKLISDHFEFRARGSAKSKAAPARGLNEIEKAKIAMASGDPFTVTLAQDTTKVSKEDWFERELVKKLAAQFHSHTTSSIFGLDATNKLFFSLSWEALEKKKPVTAFMEQFRVFLNEAFSQTGSDPSTTIDTWIITGRAVKFAPLKKAIEDQANSHGKTLIFAENIHDPGSTDFDPKESLIKGALTIAANLSDFTEETQPPAHLFFVKDAGAHQDLPTVLEAKKLNWIEEQKLTFTAPGDADHVVIARCGPKTAKYIVDHRKDHQKTAETLRRFLLTTAFKERAPLPATNGDDKITVEFDEGTAAATMSWPIFTVSGSSAKSDDVKFSLTRFGNRLP